jgi:hypothetical protein
MVMGGTSTNGKLDENFAIIVRRQSLFSAFTSRE